MPHIPLESHLPGITGLLEYNKVTAQPIRDLTQILLRGPSSLFFGASQGVLSAYIPQLFSTGIRATATGFCFNIGRIFTATAVLFVGVLVSTLGGYSNALFIFSLIFLVGLLVVLFVHEKPAANQNAK